MASFARQPNNTFWTFSLCCAALFLSCALSSSPYLFCILIAS